MALASTPVRSLGTRGSDDCILLRDIGLAYRDGGEPAVLRILSEAKNLASTSDELVRSATDWAQTYHLHPSRANIVRCLELPAEARVLEIGAGCGAITRYLGETCATVDALEPVPERAAVARARTRDLASVEVFVGELADVPAEPTYDVIVVIGVLEYVAGGAGDRAAYLEFLRGVTERLADGGTLVLAIENQLGVKYLVGAPEDHSNLVFDGIEGYPFGGPARTFVRAQLEGLLSEVGLLPTFRAAFPDYKMTRAVLGTFPASARSLLYRIPQFPSPDWVAPRPKLADERSLWRTLVGAGLEQETGNSFLVLAGKGTPSPLWADGVSARFYSTGRRTRFSAETVVRTDGGRVRFVRRPITDLQPEPSDRFTVRASDEDFQPGEDLLGYVAAHRDIDLPALLQQWLDLVDANLGGAAAGTLDVVPHNLIRTEAGELRTIDIELVGEVTRDEIIRRGLFWMAYHVSRISPFGRWGAAETVRDLAVLLGLAVGLDGAGAWLEQAVRDEVAVQLEVQNGPQLAMTVPEWEQKFRADLLGALDQRLADLPLGERLPGQHDALVSQMNVERQQQVETIALLRADVELLRGQLIDTLDRYQALERSPMVHLAMRLRRLVGRALPQGSRRRELAMRLGRGRV